MRVGGGDGIGAGSGLLWGRGVFQESQRSWLLETDLRVWMIILSNCEGFFFWSKE